MTIIKKKEYDKIKGLHKNGWKMAQIARIYKVSRERIRQILSPKNELSTIKENKV